MIEVTLPPLPPPSKLATSITGGLEYWAREAVEAWGREAVLAERERCAKVCEAESFDDPADSADDIAYNMAVGECAAAIRNA